MKRNGFTLVEVMVAAMLISVVGLSLLQMHQNSAELSDKMQKKFSHSDWPLMLAFEEELQKTDKSINFKTLMKPFSIQEREIRKNLDLKAGLRTELFSRIDASDMAKSVEEETQEIRPVLDALRLEVYQQSIDIDKQTYILYRVVKQ